MTVDGGEEVCQEMVMKDVITPLIALLKQVCFTSFSFLYIVMSIVCLLCFRKLPVACKWVLKFL